MFDRTGVRGCDPCEKRFSEENIVCAVREIIAAVFLDRGFFE